MTRLILVLLMLQDGRFTLSSSPQTSSVRPQSPSSLQQALRGHFSARLHSLLSQPGLQLDLRSHPLRQLSL